MALGFEFPIVSEADKGEFFAATISSIREQLGGQPPAVIFDWKRTLYDPYDREILPEAVELLDLLNRNGVAMHLVGKGGDDMHKELDRLGLREYFSTVLYRQGEKDADWYAETIPDFHPGMIFIGDKPDSEIQVGNRMGAYTIRVRQGEFAHEEPEAPDERADYTVGSLKDVRYVVAAMLGLTKVEDDYVL